jgi:hypothetical protein
MILTRTVRLALTTLAAALQGCAGAESGPPPASTVVDRYMEAVGGWDVEGRFASRHVVAEMSVPATGTSMTTEVWTAKPNRMLSRTVTNGMSIVSGFDGITAWAIADDQPRLLDRATFEEALGNANLDKNVDFAAAFPTMETIGERTVDGHPCWNVRMVDRKGVEVRNCFDKDSGLLIGTLVPGRNAPAGGASTEVVLSEYRDFDGLRMPTLMTATIGGRRMITTIKSVSHAPIPDSMFALPPSVRALVH